MQDISAEYNALATILAEIGQLVAEMFSGEALLNGKRYGRVII